MKTEVHRKKRTTKEKRGKDEKNTRVRLGCRRLKDFITLLCHGSKRAANYK